VLELVLSEGQRPVEDRVEAGRRLQAVGLGLWVGENVALGPLVRSMSDPVVYGVLLERLPTELWPKDAGGRQFMAPMLLRARLVANPPPTRMAGHPSIHYAPLVREALVMLEERTKLLPSGREAAEDVLKIAWFAPLALTYQEGDEALRSLRDGQSHNLRVLDQAHLEDPEQRALVALLRLLAEPVLMGGPPDIAAHLRRIEEQAMLLGIHSKHSTPTVASSIKLLAATVLLSRCQEGRRLHSLSEHAGAQWRSKPIRARDADSNVGHWMALEAELLRLRGLSAAAARLHQAALSAKPEGWLDDEKDWGRWELARARREAGYAALAFSELHRLLSRLHLHRGELVPLEHELLLELASIELDRGSTAKAHGHCVELGKQLKQLSLSRTAIRAEALDCAVQLIEGSMTGLEPRLWGLLHRAETTGDLRLQLLVDFVLGDLLVHTHRYDAARERYTLAYERAEILDDQLGQACALEKSAHLDEILGRKREAIEQLLRAAELDATTEHHVEAARQFRRAAELGEQLGAIEQAADLRARAIEQTLVAEHYEIDIVEWAERRKAKVVSKPVAAAELGADDVVGEDAGPAEPEENTSSD
jgi:hypothetical protein